MNINKNFSEMKRSIVIAFLCAFLSVPSLFAQTEDTRPLFGVRVGVDANLPGKWHGDGGGYRMYKGKIGGVIGGVCNIWLGRDFYLEPGVSLFYDKFQYDLIVAGDFDGHHEIKDPKFYKAGVRIPVVAGYTMSSDKLSMSVYTGPELSYAFAGKVDDKDIKPEDVEILEVFGKHGAQRRLDCAWKVGLGFPFSDWSVNLDAAIGLTDLLKSDLSYREHRLTLSLTRYF